MAGDSRMIDDARSRKVTRARLGLMSFMVCLSGAVIAIASLAPLVGVETALGRPLPLASAGLGWLAGLFMLAAFASFGVLISGLVMAPSDMDIRPDLESSLPVLIRIMVGAMAAFMVLVLSSAIVAMAALFIQGHNPLFAAVALLCLAMMVFSAGVGYALLRSFNAPGAVQTLSARIATAVITRTGDGNGAGYILGKLEWLMGGILSVGLSLLMGWEDLISVLRPFIGGRRADAAERILSTGDAMLYLFSFVIMAFAAAFIVKGLRMIIETRRYGVPR